MYLLRISLVNVALFFAVAEQIVFDGEKNTLTFVAMGILALLSIANLFNRRSLKRGIPNYSSLNPGVVNQRRNGSLFSYLPALPVLGLAIAFAALAQRDRDRHMALADEDLYGLIPGHLVASCLLVIVALGSFVLLASKSRKLVMFISTTLLAFAGVFCVLTLSSSVAVSGFLLDWESQFFFLPLIIAAIVWLATARSAMHPPVSELTHLLLSAALICFAALAVLGAAFHARDDCFAIQKTRYPIPSQLIVQLLSAEDPIFFSHAGVDWHRLREAVREAIEDGKFGRGGSTISMQLAKVVCLVPEKTLSRKLFQIVLGARLEQTTSKIDILYRYLESVPFAPHVVGLRAAAQHFFQKLPQELTEEESMDLVQTIYNPTVFHAGIGLVSEETVLRRAVIGGLAQRYCSRITQQLSAADAKFPVHLCEKEDSIEF